MEKHHSEGKNVRRTLHTKRKRKWYKTYTEKATSPKTKNVWLAGRLHIEGRLNEGLRLQRKHTNENEAKQNKCDTTRERHHDICKPNARRAQVRATCGESTRASEPARARLLWAILSLVLPVTFGHTTACRSPALVFSAAVNFSMKCSTPCSAVRAIPPRPGLQSSTGRR